MPDDLRPPYRIQFDSARDPYAARNALGIASAGGPYQPLDADLTAIAALTGTNTIYYRSAADTWSPVVVSTGLAFSGGNLTTTGGTWAAWSPTITAASGTITSTTVNRARYAQDGKTVTALLDVTITNAGTGAGALIVTLPVTAAALRAGMVGGRESAVVGYALCGHIDVVSTSLCMVFKYDGTTVITTNHRPILTIVYEAA